MPYDKNNTRKINLRKETVDPTTSNDVNDNHLCGDMWVNTASGDVFFLRDCATGDWVKVFSAA